MPRPPLILASASARRRELLALTGIPFTCDPVDADEHCELPGDQAVMVLSERKARAAALRHPGAVILGSDTLVCLDGRPMGKPHTPEEAFDMLRSLRGRRHHVYTGVTVLDPQGGRHSGLSASEVEFAADFSDEMIRRYIATGEPMDKAGAYALQGIAGLWIRRVDGSSSGVIGLPLELTRRLLRECGLEPLTEEA